MPNPADAADGVEPTAGTGRDGLLSPAPKNIRIPSKLALADPGREL